MLWFCMLVDSSVIGTGGVGGSIISEVAAVLRDAETQWMVFLCLGSYFLGFVLVQSRHNPQMCWGLDKPNIWLTGTVVIAVASYALHYSTASKSIQALTFLFGAVLGQSVAAWSVAQKPGNKLRSMFVIVVLLIGFLSVASVWKTDSRPDYQYRGQTRWTGPWNNPNLYGLLMGLGLVLATGLTVQSLRTKDQLKTATGTQRTHGWRFWMKTVFFLAAAGVTSMGLVKSLSRGAWLATLCGLAYLFWQRLSRGPFPISESHAESRLLLVARDSRLAWLRRNWLIFCAVLVSVAVLVFWHCHHTEHLVARRALSVGNVNDFSWRNRVAAWEGTLQMMAEKPWFGLGWSQPEPVYNHYYRPIKLNDSAAIQMNDYLVLGATLGMPAMACFLAYLWLSLTGKSERSQKIEAGGQGSESAALDSRLATMDMIPVVCRAGAIVLLVGFWFDGGLFSLATAAPFWMLLELGSIRHA